VLGRIAGSEPEASRRTPGSVVGLVGNRAWAAPAGGGNVPGRGLIAAGGALGRTGIGIGTGSARAVATQARHETSA
jgi:hypothetical protein